MLRIDKLKQLDICDAYFISSSTNRYYFSGFKSSFGYVIYAEGNAYFLTDKRYGEEARAYFNGQDIKVIYGNKNQLNESIQEIFNSASINTVGYEDNRISCSDFNDLSNLINKKFIAVGKQIDKLRIIKDEYELSQIEAAQKITDKAFGKILTIIKGGMTERDICTELEYQLKINGADGIAFDTIITSGSNSSLPHASISKRKIEIGDFIVMDFGAKYNGYCSDMSRTVSLGKPSPDMVKVYDNVSKAQTLAINALKAGINCKEIFNISNNYFSANGYEKQFLHGLGHGLGLEIHEGPFINNISDEILEKNTVVTIEPGIYIEKSFGVRIEDLIIIKENGIKNLTNADKKLIIL